ncbi:CAP domain-containing protein [Verrucomicrobium sp. 3C]|uniref:CAP domain-containing protein n=1 Tax=Verrucomicrobium sp. 3C TaxID=1134055 RepID=UPI0012DFC8AE|nr:CAP domain-containing protein [Verrucomicrobium sp. 3C]
MPNGHPVLPRPGRRLLLATTALFVLLSPGTPAPAAVSSPDLPAFRQELLARINRLREHQDLPPLEADPRLQAASQEWAERLAAERRLRHRSDDSLSSLLEEGGWETINENLYYGSEPLNPGRVLMDWERSPLHRKNLLNPAIRLAGLGRAVGGNGAAYVVFNGAGGKRQKTWEELWQKLPFPRRGG